MSLLKTGGIVVAIAVAGVLIAAATRSGTFRVQKIFTLIDDLHRFNTWNPFEKKDPNLKRSYSDGNKNVGKGTIEIVDTAPASRVTMTLHMLEPFETRNTVDFILQPRGDTTEVTWAMQGTEFEAGLASLKTIAEKTP